MAFVIPKQSDTLADREAARDEETRLWRWWTTGDRSLWSSGACLVCLAAPKTRSGKMLRRTIQKRSAKAAIRAIPTTIDDPASLQQISPRGIAVKPDSRVRQRVKVATGIVGCKMERARAARRPVTEFANAEYFSQPDPARSNRRSNRRRRV